MTAMAAAGATSRPRPARDRAIARKDADMPHGCHVACLLSAFIAFLALPTAMPTHAADDDADPRYDFLPPLVLDDEDGGAPGAAAGSEKAAPAVPAAPKPSAVPAAAMAPVPDEASQQEHRRTIQEMFKAEYAKTGLADMAALAAALREHALKATPGSPERFVLWRESIDLALKAKEGALAMAGARELAKRYDLPDKADFLMGVCREAAKSAPRSEEPRRELGFACLELADCLIADDRLDDAATAVSLARNLTLRLKDTAVKAAVKAQGSEIQRLRAEAARIQPMMKRLSENPDDPAANLAVGRHLCLVREAWDKGLPHLGRGEGPLALAAQAEAAATAPPQWLAAANAWWALAEAEAEANAKGAMARHAGDLYERARPGLEGLDLTKAEKRIADIERQFLVVAPTQNLALLRQAALAMNFENVRGGRVPDLSGNGNHGRTRGKVLFRPGVSGLGATFDGETAAIVIPNHPSLQLADDLTIAFWIQTRRLGVRQNPYNKCYGGEGTITIEVGGNFNFIFGPTGTHAEPYMVAGSGKTVAPRMWTHCVVVRDLRQRECAWYLNGELAAKRPIPEELAKPKASTMDLILGHGYAGGLDGQLDEVAVWGRALSEKEIRQLHKLGVGGQSF